MITVVVVVVVVVVAVRSALRRAAEALLEYETPSATPSWVSRQQDMLARYAAAPPDGVHVLSGHPDQLAETVWRLL